MSIIFDITDKRKQTFISAWRPIHDAIVKEVNSECQFFPQLLLLTTSESLINNLSNLNMEQLYDKLVKTRINIEHLIGTLIQFKSVKVINLNSYSNFDIVFEFSNNGSYKITYTVSVKNSYIAEIHEYCFHSSAMLGVSSSEARTSGHNETVFSMAALKLVPDY